MKKLLLLTTVMTLAFFNVIASDFQVLKPLESKHFKNYTSPNTTIKIKNYEAETGTHCYLQTVIIIHWADGTESQFLYEAYGSTCAEAGRSLDQQIGLDMICFAFGFGC